MGYQTVTNGVYGFNFIAPTFITVGDTETSIQDIRLSISEDVITGADELQILDEGGATLDIYAWYPASWSGLDKDGWINSNTELANVKIQPGKSVLINLQQDDTPIVVAGQVELGKREINGVFGFNFIGNNTPLPMNVQDIKVDVDPDSATGADELQILDEGGATKAIYAWYPASWSGHEKDGWIDAEGALLDFDIAPGMGVLVNLQQDSKITIGAAE